MSRTNTSLSSSVGSRKVKCFTNEVVVKEGKALDISAVKIKNVEKPSILEVDYTKLMKKPLKVRQERYEGIYFRLLNRAYQEGVRVLQEGQDIWIVSLNPSIPFSPVDLLTATFNIYLGDDLTISSDYLIQDLITAMAVFGIFMDNASPFGDINESASDQLKREKERKTAFERVMINIWNYTAMLSIYWRLHPVVLENTRGHGAFHPPVTSMISADAQREHGATLLKITPCSFLKPEYEEYITQIDQQLTSIKEGVIDEATSNSYLEDDSSDCSEEIADVKDYCAAEEEMKSAIKLASTVIKEHKAKARTVPRKLSFDAAISSIAASPDTVLRKRNSSEKIIPKSAMIKSGSKSARRIKETHSRQEFRELKNERKKVSNLTARLEKMERLKKELSEVERISSEESDMLSSENNIDDSDSEDTEQEQDSNITRAEQSIIDKQSRIEQEIKLGRDQQKREKSIRNDMKATGYKKVQGKSRRAMDMDRFNGKEDSAAAEVWLHRFERATSGTKNSQVRCATLISLLDENATHWHFLIDNNCVMDWKTLRECFIRRFIGTKNSASKELSGLNIRHGETPEKLYARSLRLAQLCGRDVEDANAAFMNALPSELRGYVRSCIHADETYNMVLIIATLKNEGAWTREHGLGVRREKTSALYSAATPTAERKINRNSETHREEGKSSGDALYAQFLSSQAQHESMETERLAVDDKWLLDGLSAHQVRVCVATVGGEKYLTNAYALLAAEAKLDWKDILCPVCTRKGHPGTRCFQRCRLCDILNPQSQPHHQDKVPCPILEIYKQSPQMRQDVADKIRLNRPALN